MISIVIPNFNSASLLEKNLPRLVKLLEQSKLDYEVVISDDASTDNSMQVVETMFTRGGLAKLNVRLLEGAKNKGFASTVDRGIRATKGEIVFTLKTDALPSSAGYFRLMLSHFSHKTHEPHPIFAVSAALETMECQENPPSSKLPPSLTLWRASRRAKEIRGQGEIYFERGLFLHRRAKPHEFAMNSHGLSISSWADGGAMAVRRDLYLKIGGFDKLYNPFYWEDVDLGYRAWKAGYKIIFEPKAVLIHTHESGSIRRHHNPSQIKTISLRNQFIFTWKNADLKHLLLYCLWEPYHSLIALKNRDVLWFQAYWQAVFRLPRIIWRRLQQRKHAILSDDQILSKSL